jgi:hypothetical protein
MSLTKSAITANSSKVLNSPSTLLPQERKQLAIDAIAGMSTITKLANDAETSRKFIYAQKEKAEEVLNNAFAEPGEEKEKVLFYIPVTKTWLIQLVIALILICRSSYQGVIELFRDLLDHSISKGHIHNIMRGVLDKARQANLEQDLSRVDVGALDEIFQTGSPVLVGCDAVSTYCYLLSEEDNRDSNTWGVHLLHLREHQNLKPHHTIADGGTGLRKGQAEAWPDIPCNGDVFHALKPMLELTINLENRALGEISESISIKKQLARPRRLSERDKHKNLEKRLVISEQESLKAIQLADDIQTLYRWLQRDILSLVGPEFIERQVLFDFVIEELRTREPLCLHRIHPVRTFLENHRDNLLAFVSQIDIDIITIAQEFEVNRDDVRALYELQGLPFSSQLRWEKDALLRKALGPTFYPVESEIKQMLDNTVRASSVVENLNSRLRNYFTLRRYLGKEYLSVLQFFLNHRRFMRSEHSERINKSPKELMTDQAHQHWLEILGFKLFKQVA